MARVLAFVPDLLFGSSVLAALQGAGHEVKLVGSLSDEAGDYDVVVLDLTAEAERRLAELPALTGSRARTLGFYSHVEVDVRRQAEAAGVDLVVPRSRMAREGPALVARLAGGA